MAQNLCRECAQELPRQEPGFVTFHICNNRRNPLGTLWHDTIPGEVIKVEEIKEIEQ